MNKILITLIASTIIFNNVTCQQCKLGLTFGVGQYSMAGLKKINEFVMKDLPFDTKVISNFPPYFYYQPSFLMKYKKINAGLIYTYSSTGSRISGKDYSGEYIFDMTVVANAPGFYTDFTLVSKNKLNFSIYSVFSVSFSKLKIYQYLTVADTVLTNETLRFKAQNLNFEPGFKLSYSIKRMIVSLNVGTLTQFASQDFYTGENKENKLYLENDPAAIKPQWNGLRTGISLFFVLDHD